MRNSKYPTQADILNDIVDYSVFDHRIIVAGSRGFYDYDFFSTQMKEIIAEIKGNFIFYSGMASTGADKLIVDFCKNEGYLYHPYPADWDRFGKGAGYVRNNIMASTATWLIAFHDGKSNGTAHMIKVAKENGLRIMVINIDKIDKPEAPTTRTIKLFTIQVPQWRLCNAIGVKFVDITAKSGIPAFAPSMDDVYAYKHGLMSEEQYTTIYKDRMFQSREQNAKYWKHLLKFDAMAFGCYCTPGDFCHRHLFIEMAKEYLEKEDIIVEMCGELTKERVEKEFETLGLPQIKEKANDEGVAK